MTKPSRILVDCERMKYPYTGLYYYCLHLANHLEVTKPQGRELCFYSRKSTADVFKGKCMLEQHSLHKYLLPSTSKFDIWHSTYQGTQYYPKRGKIKVILTIHDLNFLYDNSKTEDKKKKYLKKIEQKIKRADHLVAISEFTLRDVLDHIDVGNTPCSVIYNGCNIEKAELKEPASIPPTPFIYTIGTIVAKKNFHVLPPLLVGNNFQLIISGITDSEAYKQTIINEASKFGVADRVIFTGSISEGEKQWYIQNCEAFVFPSISEGFGLPVVEAMHFGKPVILSNATSLPEIGGDEAWYFNSFDPSDMQTALKTALDQYKMNDRAAAIKARADFFSWDTSARKYHEVYNSLL
jgi:glycosyltransferase involved in cell wall biosynthesis